MRRINPGIQDSQGEPLVEQASSFVDRGMAKTVTSASFPQSVVDASFQGYAASEGCFMVRPAEIFPFGPVRVVARQ